MGMMVGPKEDSVTYDAKDLVNRIRSCLIGGNFNMVRNNIVENRSQKSIGTSTKYFTKYTVL